MERAAIIAFMCLSVACLVNCQIPTCPQDVQDNPQHYYRSSYLFGSPIVSKQCTYTIRSGYLGIYFGPPRIIRKIYYVCAEGLQQLMISLPGQRPLYICDEEPIIVEEEGSADETTDPTDETTEITEGSTDPTDETTEETEDTEEPTWPGGLKECPSPLTAYQTNDYIFASLDKIVQHQCVIRTSVNGVPMHSISAVWLCKEGYERKRSRPGQYKCVEV